MTNEQVKPIRRVYAVSKRDQDDKRRADWFEIGAEWPTSNPSVNRITQNDGYVPLIATGRFDIVSKVMD